MAIVNLPKELVSLIYHVELNNSGWWKRATYDLIFSAIWLSPNKKLTAQQIVEILKSYSISLNTQTIKTYTKTLIREGHLTEIVSGTFGLSESMIVDITKKVTQGKDVEFSIQRDFQKVIKNHLPQLTNIDEINQMWFSFNKDVLIPTVQSMGIKTYEFITDQNNNLNGSVQFDKFLINYEPGLHQSLKEAISDFLSTDTPGIRSYVLRHLNAFFFIEASGLKKSTVESLSREISKKPVFNIFIDTNFLFSSLEIHTQSSNQGVESLLNLTTEISEYVEVNFYVLPQTISEARKSIQIAKNDLKELPPYQPQLFSAMAQLHPNGIISKYYERCEELGSQISIDSYFAPYLTRLVEILGTKKISLLDEDISRLYNRPEIISDINDQLLRVKNNRYGKNYIMWEHDISLWYFVVEKRSSFVSSPLNAIYWIITFDSSFFSFDKYKITSATSLSNIRVCIDPNLISQVLQFWVPRTPQLEETLFDSLLWPFLLREFDNQDARTRQSIINAVNRFELGDIPQELISEVITDVTLQKKMEGTIDSDDQIELVKNTLLDHLNKQHQSKEFMLTSHLAEKDQQIQSLYDELKNKTGKNDQAANLLIQEHTSLQQEVNKLNTVRQEQDNAINNLKSRIDIEKENSKIEEAKIWFLLWLIISFIPILVLSYVFSNLSQDWFSFKNWSLFLFFLPIISLPWFGVFSIIGNKNHRIVNSRFFISFKKIRNWILIGFIAVIFINVISNVIYDKYK